MGLTLSSDLLLEELNAVSDTSRNFKLIKGLVQKVQDTGLFLGLWDCANNTPDITTLTPNEGSFFKVTNAANTSPVGTCLSGDWVIYLDNAWSVIRLTIQETGSSVLIISAPNNITVRQSNTNSDGYLSSADWNRFNSKQQFIADNLSFSDTPSANGPNVIMSARAVSQLLSASTNVCKVPHALWYPSTNRPELRDNAGLLGYNYYVAETQSIDLGLGTRLFTVGSVISYNIVNKKWE